VPQPWSRRASTAAALAAVLLAVACTGSTTPTPKPPAQSVPSPASTAVSAKVDHGITVELNSAEVYKSVRAVLVMAEGRTVFERYYNSSPTASRDVESVTKSVMSTLVGIALAEGKLRSLDQTLAQLLPAYAATMKPDVAATTLRQVLTMTAGFSGDFNNAGLEFMASPDWVGSILAGPVRPPGEVFAYSNGAAQVLSAILVQATGRSVLEYARAKLFDPLGIVSRPSAEPLAVESNLATYNNATFAWPVDPQRRNLGWSLLKLRPRDMAKLGSLYLNEGRWEGKQVVPAAWVRDATRSHVAAQGAGNAYGYLWWVAKADGDPAYLAWGAGGQLIEVVPRRHLMVVVSTELNLLDATSQGVPNYFLNYLVDSVIAPAFRP
jgi:CubicO group peptidase (beta-lactamase class C family)